MTPVATEVEIRRLPTGVPGLDPVLGGGVPEFYMNLIVGPPGSGKTTLCHQMMFALARPERRALYFKALGEAPLKMLRYQQHFSFFAPEIVDGSIRILDLAMDVAAGDYARILERIRREVEAFSPGLVFVDAFRTIMAEAGEARAGSMSPQEFIQELGVNLSGWQVTLFLGRFPPGGVRRLAEEALPGRGFPGPAPEAGTGPPRLARRRTGAAFPAPHFEERSIAMLSRCLKRRIQEVPRRMAVRRRDASLLTRRHKPVPSASGSLDRREAATDRREAALTVREAAVEQRENAAEAGMRKAWIKAEFNALKAGVARDANEQLVLSAVDDQERREEAELQTEQMSYLAEHDALTELPNRGMLSQRLEAALAHAEDSGAKVALMYLDIDHFKEINDTHGHLVGDKVLQSVARHLQACVRRSDTVCRQGGDEFLVLLPKLEDVEDCAIIARKLNQALALPHVVGELRIRVTLSIGICIYPDLATDGEALQANADAALYRAKAAGRNTFRVFAPSVDR
jgi:diguanylate cyclase (GGDEF)-like protein